MSVSSRQLNYLIWRYLQESGFELSTYALQQESRANKLEDELGEQIPMGALVSLVQKGIQLSEMEAGVRKVERSKDVKPYTLFGALPVLAAQREEESLEGTEGEQVEENGTKTNIDNNNNNNLNNKSRNDNNQNDKEGTNTNGHTTTTNVSTTNGAAVQVDIEKPVPPIRDLEPMYKTEPSQCSQWSPIVKDILSIGQLNESSATLLNFSPTFASSDGKPASLTLKHSPNSGTDAEVTVISWNCAGNFLITGSFDGQMKMWSSDGKLRHSLALHKAPIMVVRWNKSGSLVLSMDCTNTVAIWDAFSGDIRQHFPGFEDPTSGGSPATGTDADWIDGTTYAITGENSTIVVYKVGERIPLLRFQGHTQPVNSIHFDVSSQLLSSGSDDGTVRLWNGKTSVPVRSFYGHNAPVMAVRWVGHVPTDNVASDTQASLDSSAMGTSLVVSGSMDGSVKVWDANNAACLVTLALHEAAVFYCEVSPNGKYLATGGLDGVLVIWDITGIKGVESSGSRRAIARHVSSQSKDDENRAVNSISWSSDSTRVFVSFATGGSVVELS